MSIKRSGVRGYGPGNTAMYRLCNTGARSLALEGLSTAPGQPTRRECFRTVPSAADSWTTKPRSGGSRRRPGRQETEKAPIGA